MRSKIAHRCFSVILFLLLSACCLTANSQDNKENSDFKLAVNLYNDGMYDLAAEQFKNFISAYASTANGIEARFYLGLTQMKLKRYEDARMTFQNFALAYVDHPKSAEAWIKVAEAFLALKNDREAASAYERVKVFHAGSPLAPDALLSAARIYLRLGERENAIRIYRSIVSDYPSSQSAPSARLILAEFKAEDGQTDQAEQEAQRVSESNAPAEVRAEALNLIGTLKMSASLFDEAENIFRTVAAQYQGTTGATRASLALGGILRSVGKTGDALRQFLDALASNPADSLRAQALYQLGLTYAKEENYDSARTCYDQIIKSLSNSPVYERTLFEAGNAALHQKDYNGAGQYFRNILSLPSDGLRSKALVRLAESAVAAGHFEEAAKSYQADIDQYPDNPFTPRVAYALGSLYEQPINNYRKAIEIFNHVVDKFPQSPYAADALVEIGRCYEKLESFEEATQSYNDVLVRYPSLAGNEVLQKRIEFLRNHRVRNRDAGMEKLARLVGDMLVQKAKANVAFQLGQVYFYDLKDYPSAAQQFTFAIENGLDEDKLIEANFLRARSYDMWSEIDSTVAEKAIIYYGAFLKQYPADKWSGDAAYYSFQLRARKKSPEEILSLAKGLLAAHLRPEFREEVLFTIGTASLAAGLAVDTLQFFMQLEQEFRNSSVAQHGLLALGSWYAGHSKPDSAIMYWQRAITNAPNGFSSAAILQRLAVLYIQLHNYGEAISTYKKIISDFPYTHEAEQTRTVLANEYFAGGQYEQAITELESYLKQLEISPFSAPYPWDITLQLAMAYERKGSGQKAMSLYGEYLLNNRTSKNAGEVYYALGILARNQGRTDEATYYFKQAATLGSAGSASQEIADLLFENGEYQEAAKQYGRLAQAETSTVRNQQFRSRIIVATLRMDKLSEGQKLITDFEKSFGIVKTSRAEFEYEKAMILYRKQDYPKASKAFGKVVDDYEGTAFAPWAQYYVGKILEVSNKLEDATKIYNDILKNSPNSDVTPHILLSLGNIQYNAEHYDEAIRFYQQILDQSDKAGDILPYAINNLIEAYESTKLYDAALKLTREFIERYPYDETIIDKKIKIGTLYTKLGYFDQAVSHFQNLLNESGSLMEAELHYDVGEAYFYKGDYQQAILEFLKVPYLVSRQGKVNWTATSLYMAGQAYEKMSKFDEAIGMYQQIVDRSGIDATFKAAARKEIDRVKSIIKKDSK
jgi:TolA-binding protein